MTALWDPSEGHEVHLEDLVGDRREEDVVDIHELQGDQLVGTQGDHQEVWGPGQGSHQGRAEEDHEEEWVAYHQQLPDRWECPACLPYS